MSDYYYKNLKPIEYVFCYILIAISGVNYFLGNKILAVVFIFALFYHIKNLKITNFLIWYIVALILILAGSAVHYSYISISNYVSLFFRLAVGYLILSILGKKFIYLYIRIMYILGIISLIFWAIFVFIPPVERLVLFNITPFFDHYTFTITPDMKPPAPHFIIYTMNHEGANTAISGLSGALASLSGFDRIYMRNSMCFTEPSTAMFFVLPALAFSLVIFKKITSKETIVFILVVLTSWSTGGYVILFLLLSGWYFTQRSGNKLIMLPITLLVAYQAFYNVESFGDELSTKFDEATTQNLQYAKRTRLVNAILDINESFSHPVFGKGFYKENRSLDYYDWRTNGTTFLLNRYGYIAFFFFFFLIYKFFDLLCRSFNVNRQFALVMIISLIMIGFGNKNFEKPLFIGLTMFSSILYHKRETNLMR